jgi:hypothetical protein
MRTYPEWFIGGPWHGRDKMRECPHLRGPVRVANVRPLNYAEFVNVEPTTDIGLDEYAYIPKYIDVFGERVLVWVGESEAGGNRESDWIRMLGQLIMFPHRTDEGRTPVDTRPITQRHQERWDVEHEVTRNVEHRYRDRIQSLERQVHDARRQRDSAIEMKAKTYRLDGETSVAILEFADDKSEHVYISFQNIVVYFDEGDGTDENPPSWVATAQESSLRDGPFTGYGTTKRAAYIALLADGLGVYARMIAIGERAR